MIIKSINIKNYRSIKENRIDDLGNALVLVGQNNAGKSSLMNALRAFWGEIDIELEDFHKNNTVIEIELEFICKNYYLKEDSIRNNSKVGIAKIPSAAIDFNQLKNDTSFSDMSFPLFKQQRETALLINTATLFEYEQLWLKGIRQKLALENEICKIKYMVEIGQKKGKYINGNDEEVKDFLEFMPNIAFIDDDRNFSEEGEGKSKTLTNDIFGNHVMKTKQDICQSCTNIDCSQCIEPIRNMNIDDLTINDLEKLMNNKIKNMSSEISEEISQYFQQNFQDEYKIMLNSSSNVNKSFALNTKIFVPALDKYVEISKVGAGLRSIYVLSLLQAYLKLEESSSHIFLIEEPEIYLHPSLQKMMAETLYEISKSNMVILTTHSPLILNRFDISNVKKVSLNDNYETIYSNSDLKELLVELGYSTSDILYSEYVIFVEGKDDKKWILQLLEKFYRVDRNKFYIVDTKSCNNIETYATLRFLNKTTLTNNFLIFRDSDTVNPNDVKRKIVNAFGENLEPEMMHGIENSILVLNYSAFENYFLNPNYLVHLRLVRSEEQFYQKIETYLNQNHRSIFEYLEVKNNVDYAVEKILLLFDDRHISQKIDDIKKYVRGHNLFGQFGQLKNKTDQYIAMSNGNDFDEILTHLDQIDYLRENRI